MDQKLSLFKLIPNIFTTMGMCAGLTGVRYAIDHNWKLAVTCIIVASFFDLIDGLTARAFKATSKFGAELDSLSDAISFGVAPALVIFLWISEGIPMSDNSQLLGWYWIPLLIYSSCAVLRLARYNVASIEKTNLRSGYFVGVPTPAASMLLLLPILMEINFVRLNVPFNKELVITPVILWTLLISCMMVSTIPTFSIRSIKLKFSKNKSIFVLIIASLSASLFIKESWIFLNSIILVYLLSIPVSFKLSRR